MIWVIHKNFNMNYMVCIFGIDCEDFKELPGLFNKEYSGVTEKEAIKLAKEEFKAKKVFAVYKVNITF